MLELFKKNIFFIVIGVIIIVFLFIAKDDEIDDDNQMEIAIDSQKVEDEPEFIDQKTGVAVIDVKGAVENPGVYEIEIDSRVNDVIRLAGGFSKDADQTVVNLAQKVQDEMVIIVPKQGGTESATPGESGGQNGSEKLRINYATQEEIETLNGIGPSKASAIIQHREENGLFQSVEDLLEVSGIGEKTLANISDFIQIP